MTGGKSKAAKGRSKKVKSDRKTYGNNNVGSARAPKTMDGITREGGATKEDLAAVEKEWNDADVYSDSTDYSSSSDELDKAEQGMIGTAAKNDTGVTTKNENKNTVQKSSYPELDKNNATTVAAKSENVGPFGVSSYPGMSAKLEYAVDNIGFFVAPKPQAASTPEPETAAPVRQEVIDKQNIEYIKNEIMGPPPRPLPVVPILNLQGSYGYMNQTQAGSALDNMLNNIAKSAALVPLFGNNGGKAEINQFAAAKAKSMEDLEAQNEPEYDPETHLNSEEFKKGVDNGATIVGQDEKMDVDVADEPVENANAHDSQAGPSSPYRVLVDCADKKTAVAVQDQLFNAAEDLPVTDITVVSTKGEFEATFKSIPIETPSDKMGADGAVMDAIQNDPMKVLGVILDNAKKAHAEGALPKSGEDSVPFNPFTFEGVANMRDAVNALKLNKPDQENGGWVGRAIEEDIAQEAIRKEKSFSGGNELVAVNDEIIDLDEADAMKTKKKANKKKKKKTAKKILMEDASTSADHDSSQQTTDEQPEQSELQTNDKSEEDNQATAEAVTDSAIDMAKTSKKSKEKNAVVDFTSVAEDIKRLAEQAKNQNMSAEVCREMLARDLHGLASCLSKEQLTNILEDATVDDIKAFLKIQANAKELLTAKKTHIFKAKLESGDLTGFSKLPSDTKSDMAYHLVVTHGPSAEFFKEGVKALNEADITDPKIQQLKFQLQELVGSEGVTEGEGFIHFFEVRFDQMNQAIVELQKLFAHFNSRMDIMWGVVTATRQDGARDRDNQRAHNTRIMVIEEDKRNRERAIAEAGDDATRAALINAAQVMDIQERSFQDQIQSVRMYVDDQTAALSDAMKDAASEFKQFKKMCEEEEVKAAEITNCISHYNQTFASFEVKLNGLQGKYDKIGNSIGAWVNRMTEIEAKLRTLPGDIKLPQNGVGSGDDASVVGNNVNLKASAGGTDFDKIASFVGKFSKELDEEMKKMAVDLVKYNETNNQILASMKNIQNHIAGLQKTSKATKTELAGVVQKVEMHATQIQELKEKNVTKVAGMTQIQADKLNLLGFKVDKATKEQSTIKTTFSDLEENVGTIRDAVNELVDLGHKAATIEKVSQTTTSLIKQGNDTVVMVNNNAAIVKKSNGDIQGQLDKHAGKLNEYDGRFDTILATLKEHHNHFNALESKAVNQTKFSERAKAQSQTYTREIKDNARAIKDTKAQLDKLQAVFDAKTAVVDGDAAAKKNQAEGADALGKNIEMTSEKLTKLYAKVEAELGPVDEIKPRRKSQPQKKAAAKVAAAGAQQTSKALGDVTNTVQTDIPSTNDKSASVQVQGTGQVKVPKVRMPQINRVISESIPATPAAASPAPMLPHPTLPGAGVVQSQPPPVMQNLGVQQQGIQSQGPRGQQQRRSSLVRDDGHSMNMGRPRMVTMEVFGNGMGPQQRIMQQQQMAQQQMVIAPPPGFSQPGGLLPQMLGAQYAQPLAQQVTYPLGHHMAVIPVDESSPPPAYAPNPDPVLNSIMALNYDMGNINARINEHANAMSLISSGQRVFRMEIRYEVGVEVERRVGLAFERVEKRLGERVDGREDVVGRGLEKIVEERLVEGIKGAEDRAERAEEKVKMMVPVMEEMARRFGVKLPEGWGG